MLASSRRTSVSHQLAPVAVGARGGERGRLRQVGRRDRARGLDGPGSAPRKQTTVGLFDRLTSASTRAATAAAGGLEISTITSVSGSCCSAASPASIVAPPTASLRSWPPVPMACETPAPARASPHVTPCKPVPAALDQPHVAARHGVGEPQRHAVDDRRARFRPHAQQPAVGRQLLQGDLLFERHVVGEEQHVQSVFQRGARLACGVTPRDRDHRQVGARRRGDGRSQRLGPLRRAGFSSGRLRGEDLFGLRQRGQGGSLVLGLDDDQQIIGPRARGLGVSSPAAAMISRLAGVPMTTAASCTPGSFSTAWATSIRVTESW